MSWHTASFEAIGVENRVTALDRETLREALPIVRAEVRRARPRLQPLPRRLRARAG